MFKYEWIWDKVRGSNFLTSKFQPFKEHENILVFYAENATYNPIKIDRTSKRFARAYNSNGATEVYGIDIKHTKQTNKRMPSSIITVPGEVNNQYKKQRFHPTQKPLALFAYLIKTYTNEGELVLDNCIGSGTTAIAAVRTGRYFIGMELEPKYVDIARERLKQEVLDLAI